MTIAIVPIAIVRPYKLPYMAMLLVTSGMYQCIMPYIHFSHTILYMSILRQLLTVSLWPCLIVTLFSGANCPVHPAYLYLDGRSVIDMDAVWISPSLSLFSFFILHTPPFWSNLPCLFRR